MGLNVLTVEINTLDDIAKQIEDVGAFLGNSNATEIAMRFRERITQFQLRFAHKEPIEVFYYSWPKPLQSIGSGAWVTKLLEQCGLIHVFASLPLAYPQVFEFSIARTSPFSDCCYRREIRINSSILGGSQTRIPTQNYYS